MYEKWYPIIPVRPQDEHLYNIKLKDGTIIKNVEFWSCGNVFLGEDKDYDFDDVVKFQHIGRK